MLYRMTACAITLVALSAARTHGSDSKQIKPTSAGFRITESASIAPGTYTFEDHHQRGAIIIDGHELTVDFTDVTLVGSPESLEADAYMGRGIVIRGRNVTVKNATVRGYKVGIYAEDSPGLTLIGCDVSRNYRQRLKSTVEREDVSDWLFGHENDDNEWLRYGAGIYLFRCPRATVVGNRARNGQNGLCMSRCDEARIADNDMSFMSGWGLAMWRSSRCEVMNNKFDWCMRGYSHGVYSRGQDSTGILVYEQCNENVFAYNSATHGGDGFFLYAGNETLERTGRGGCNRNIVYRNDFSHAAANGIEATFSSGNVFVENILKECTHGVWAGYSYHTLIHDNTITDCTYGVSIEHGHDNLITGNTITDTRLGVHLWWDDDKDLLASAFGKAHGRCPSEDNRVIGNRFERVKTAIRLADDRESVVGHNTMSNVATSVRLKGDLTSLSLSLTDAQRATVKDEGRSEVKMLTDDPDAPAPLYEGKPIDMLDREPRLANKGKKDAFLPEGTRRGREYIFVDEWGPYDFTNVRVFPSKVYGGDQAVFQLLGPDCKFRITDVSGKVQATPDAGTLPSKLTVKATAKGAQPFELAIEAGGQKLKATGMLLSTDWHVAFYGWSKSDDPRSGSDAWRRIISADPVDEMTVSSIDFAWASRAPSDKVPPDYFATVATTKVHLPTGKWRVRTVSDDGVRVFLDGKEVIHNWTWHAPTLDEARVELSDGRHDIHIEHFEIDGYAQLQFRLEPMGE